MVTKRGAFRNFWRGRVKESLRFALSMLRFPFASIMSDRSVASIPRHTASTRAAVFSRLWQLYHVAAQLWSASPLLSCFRGHTLLECCVLRRSRIRAVFLQVHPWCVLVGRSDHDYGGLWWHEVTKVHLSFMPSLIFQVWFSSRVLYTSPKLAPRTLSSSPFLMRSGGLL